MEYGIMLVVKIKDVIKNLIKKNVKKNRSTKIFFQLIYRFRIFCIISFHLFFINKNIRIGTFSFLQYEVFSYIVSHI